MRRIAALTAFTLALVVGVTGLVATPSAAAPEDDIASVISRLEDYYLGQGDEIIIANGINLARTSDALDYVASQNADGSWSDVNYADRTSSANGSVWSAYGALYRMLAMAQAYRDPAAEGHGDRRLIDALDRSLLYWDQANPGNTNWWETEIGESIAMGRISMFVGPELSAAAFQVSLKHNTGKLDPVGANGAWRTSNYIFEGLATRDYAKVTEGFATIVATITVDNSGTVMEAVQPDASFWAHGAQLYSEGYGMVLFTYAALWADVSRGTGLAFSRDQLDSIAFYFINGTRWLIRGEIGMLYLNYRPPASIQGVTRHSADFIEPLQRMVRTDALNSTAYRAVLDGILGTTETNGVTGDKYFWRSEFSSHIRDDYAIFTRLNSSRTFGAELRTSYRDELGNPVYWNAMGSTAIQVNNREYLDLGPTFDWFHYPGVTAPYVKRTERGVENRGRNGDGGSFTGGVSNGEYGVSVLTLDTAGTNAQKSYFTFDDELVALGAGITSTSTSSVHTTINQAASKTNATVGGQAVDLGTDSLSVGTANWAYNDEVGYVFAPGQSVSVSNKTQTGSWEGGDVLQRDAFTVYVDHGARPASATYDYTVLPAASPAQVEAYADKPAVSTLRNDTEVQAVRHVDLGLTMATFYKAGSLDLGDGRTLTVDKPGIVILDERGETPVVSVANPDKPGLEIALTLTGAGSDWFGRFSLGEGPNVGKTVTAALVAGALPDTSDYSASGTAEGETVAALGDDDGDTVWASDRDGVAWVQKQLPRGSWVTKVAIDWADEFATDFLVQTSVDGSTWVGQKRVRDAAGGLSEIAITPTPATRVRVLLLDGDGERYGIREFTVTSSVNLALDAGTRASGYAGYNLAYAMADGDPTTRWRGNNSDTAWGQVDLGSTQPVSTVRLSWEAAFAKNYKIQLSDDGTSWRDAYITPTGGGDGGIDVITLDGQTARFVRMQTVKRALDYGPSLWDFEVFADRLVVDAPTVPTGKGNLAVNRPTTADSFYNNNATVVASKATDGSLTSKWSSARVAAEHWVQVDLGGVLAVSRAVVTWESGTSNNYRIEGSRDGTTWVPLARVQSAQPTLKHVHDFASSDVRFVRLTGVPATQYGLNIYELELYGGSSFDCTAALTVGRGGSGIVAGTISPLSSTDVFSAVTVDASVATIAGEPRVGADGRVEVDVAAHEPGRTQVLLTHAGGTELAQCDVTVVADASGLEEQLAIANALDSTVFTPQSWASFVRTLDAAKDLLRAGAATQEQIDQTTAALAAALGAIVRLDAVPGSPLAVTASSSASDAATVQWSAPASGGGSAISAYEVTVGGSVTLVGGSTLMAFVTGLAPGEHAVSVRAQNAGGWSAPSAPITVVVEADAPSAPVLTVSGDLTAGGTIVVTGTGFDARDEFTVELRSDPITLGRVTADRDGSFRLTARIPLTVAAGQHSVLVLRNGQLVASAGVVIGAADSGSGANGTPGGALSTTGITFDWVPKTAGIALLLVLLGVAAVAAAMIRRRRDA